MNKVSKRISTTFLVISVATFIAGLISCVGTFMSIISLYVDHYSVYATNIINWILRVALYITILVFAISTLKKIFSNQEVEEKKLIKLNYLFAGSFLALCVVSWTISMIEYSVRLGYFPETATSVTTFITTLCGMIFFILILSNKFNEKQNKVFSSLGYLFFFIYLLICSIGLTSYTIPLYFFLYFFVFSGLLQALTYNTDLTKCFARCRCDKKTDTRNPNEETQKEEINKETSLEE